MNETGAHYYFLDFPEQDKKTPYKVHAKLAWSFFQLVVPASTRSWLSQTDPRLVDILRSYLTAEEHIKDSAFAQLISKADQSSTSKDKRNGSRQRFATAKRKPIIEVMIQALREMLQEKGTYFNVAHNTGGALFRKNELVYLTCPNVVWVLKEYLQKTGSEYIKNMPTDNQRVYDIFLENGAVEPSLYDPYKAVHQIVPVYVRQDGTKVNRGLSCLCFKISTLYPDGTNLPDEYQGELIISTMPPEAQENEHEPEKPNNTQNEPQNPTKQIAQDGSVERAIQENLKNQDIPLPPKKRIEQSATPIAENPEPSSEAEVTEEAAQSFFFFFFDLPSELQGEKEDETETEQQTSPNEVSMVEQPKIDSIEPGGAGGKKNNTPDISKLKQLPNFDAKFVSMIENAPEQISLDAIPAADYTKPVAGNIFIFAQHDHGS